MNLDKLIFEMISCLISCFSQNIISFMAKKPYLALISLTLNVMLLKQLVKHK